MVQYLVTKQVRPIIKEELQKMKTTITEALVQLQNIPADGSDEEWAAIPEKVVFYAQDVSEKYC